VQSDVTVSANGILNNLRTAAASFTLTNYRHFYINQSTLGAGSAVTNQYGVYVESNLTGATNNYGFYGGIASGTNRWNLYMAGTAANYMAGVLNIGTTTLSGYTLDVNGTGRFSGNAYFNSLVYLTRNNQTLSLSPTTGTSSTFIDAANTSGRMNIGVESSAGGTMMIGTSAYSIGFASINNNDLYIGTSGAWGMKMAHTTQAATFSSSVTATSFFESSDSRLKTLIQDNYQTKGIASITPKLYTKNGKVELGYYAQDFVGVLDSAVSKGSDDMLSLSYREVHTAKIYALEQRIKELETK